MTMKKDAIDLMLSQWSQVRPELDTSALSVVVRILALHKIFLRQATNALTPLNLELWEYDVLSALRRQGAPYELAATELARATSLSSGAMTNRIDKLESKRLVSRKVDPHDRRGVIVGLTGTGTRLIDKAIQHRLEAADRGVKGLTRKERATLAALLRKVVLATDVDAG
jgi:DNA-binding MarR family transcriptional regulator